jgi:hypothetical protein
MGGGARLDGTWIVGQVEAMIGASVRAMTDPSWTGGASGDPA